MPEKAMTEFWRDENDLFASALDLPSRSPWCDILMAKNFDVHNYIALCRDHYEKVGLGADYVKTLFR